MTSPSSVPRFVHQVAWFEDALLLSAADLSKPDSRLVFCAERGNLRELNAFSVGISLSRKFFYLGTIEAVSVCSSIEDLRSINSIPWASGWEPFHENAGSEHKSLYPQEHGKMIGLDENSLISVNRRGIHVLEKSKARPLHPVPEMQGGKVEPSWLPPMGHACVSPDGNLICVGSQESRHLVFSREGALIDEIPPLMDYCNASAFVGDFLLLSSCYMSSGQSELYPLVQVGQDRSISPSIELPPHDRAEAVVDCDGFFVLGTVSGEVLLFDYEGELVRSYQIDGGITSMDYFRNRLAVATAIGLLHTFSKNGDELVKERTYNLMG